MPPRTFPVLVAALTYVGATTAQERIEFDRVTPVAADRPIPVADFFRPALFSNATLNDAGTHVAASFPTTVDTAGLLVVDLAQLEARPLVLALPGERTIESVAWLSDERLSFRGFALERWETAVSVAVVGRSLRSYPMLEGATGSLVAAPIERKHRPLFHIHSDIADGPGRRGRVVEINSDIDLSATLEVELAGAGTPMMRNRNDRRITSTFSDIGNVLKTRYLADRMGELAFGFTAADGVNKLHVLSGGSWVESPINLDRIEVVTCGEREGELIVRGAQPEGKPRSLQFMDARTGEAGELILEDAGYDFHGHVVREPRTRQILGLTFDRAVPVVHWFSEEYAALQKFLDGNFQGRVVRMWPVDASGNRVFARVFSDRHAPAYYVADLSKRTLGLVKNAAPWLDPERMLATSMFKYRTADGARLDAYVTLPKGASKERPAPLVVLPQSRRDERMVWGFDPEAQLFASRGYAVLRPNTRGSVGTQWQFPYEDRWAFRKMHDDLAAATRAVLRTGLIDANRIAIVGTDFGGYLASGALAFHPDLFRCAASVSGIYDWNTWLDERHESRFDNPEYGELMRWLGSPRDQREKYEALSIVRGAEQMRGALLVAYDKDGWAIKINEARRLIDALKRRGVTHEVVTTTGEGPGWGHLGEKVDLYARILAFLEKHLPAGTAPAR